MRVVVTCGPAIAPIDDVRRITNFSTGELGILLANAMSLAGHEVICLKGEMATSPLAVAPEVDLRPFSTNDNLLLQVRAIENPGAIFHAAALCDFEVDSVVDENGRRLEDAKISSREGGVTIVLKPATKVLAKLRGFLPGAFLAGWKYELNGDRASAVEAGRRQFRECDVDLCILNGRAYGAGFGLLGKDGNLAPVNDKAALCAELVRRVALYSAP